MSDEWRAESAEAANRGGIGRGRSVNRLFFGRKWADVGASDPGTLLLKRSAAYFDTKGSEDPTVTYEVGKQLQDITGGQIASVERSGHDIMLEDRATCHRATSASEMLLNWLSKQ